MSTHVQLDTRLNTAAVQASGQVRIVYALLEAYAVGEVDHMSAGPSNIALVLDTSGSMAGHRLERVLEAVDALIATLGPNDRIAVIGFADEPTVILDSQPIAGLTQEMILNEVLGRIRAGGGTRFTPALESGLDQIAANFDTSGHSRLVLLTDGRERSQRDARSCRTVADRASALGVPIIALGVGADWNEDFLIEIALRSGGHADYIARPEDLPSHFTQIVDHIQASSIRDVELTLRLVDGVTPRRVWRTLPQIQNLGTTPLEPRFVSVRLGDLDTRSGQALLVELEIPPRLPGIYRLAQAELSYSLSMGQSKLTADVGALDRVRSDILVQYVADARMTSTADAAVSGVIDRVFAHDFQARAFQAADRGDVDGATRKLNAAATILLDQGETDLANLMREEAQSLGRGEDASPEGRKTIRFDAGKTVRLYR